MSTERSLLLMIDFDSTLTTLEGLDELARVKLARGEIQPADIDMIVSITHQAMNGSMPIDEALASRLAVLKPSAKDCEALGQAYIENLVPNACESIAIAKAQGWRVVIVSGGLEQSLVAPAAVLGIDEVIAVRCLFDASGAYVDFDRSSMPARHLGKVTALEALTRKYSPSVTVVVGDGATDADAGEVATAFIAFTGVAARPKVVARATTVASSMPDVCRCLEKLVADRGP
jgi:HAD superfamily phosphoserine phosphatase-like hydrolase